MSAFEQQRSEDGFGGSELAAAAGIHPYKPRIVLWQEKVGERPPVADNRWMRWGRLLEPPVRQEYVDRHGVAVTVPAQSLHHAVETWARATPDGIVVEGDEWAWGLEIKTAGYHAQHRWGEPGSDEIPGEYLVQCQHYMAVTGLDRWDVAVLVAGSDYREYVVEYDPELVEMLWNEGREFLWHVDHREPPPPDASPEYGAYLADRYPHLRDELRPADDAATERAVELMRVRDEIKELEQRKSLLLNELRAFAGEHRGIQFADSRLTWSKVERAKVDYKAIAQELIPADQLAELEVRHSRVTSYERANYPRRRKAK